MEIKDQVSKRILGFGYAVADSDGFMLDFSIEKAETEIQNICNISDIPVGLKYVWIDRAAGIFLSEKAAVSADGFIPQITAGSVKQIKEGDVTVSYTDEETPLQKFERLISTLKNSGKGQFEQYRRLTW
ncbi:hypothetical protein [Scatolibacter rhodanostii]|uniref:hypothetical protein n=1 Tax=Scatolibacter rhodanostii TaxID=2014781 RepID=UPI000C076A57|nr:hypothetical protein [Scatolibacter rhodanostii]